MTKDVFLCVCVCVGIWFLISRLHLISVKCRNSCKLCDCCFVFNRALELFESSNQFCISFGVCSKKEVELHVENARCLQKDLDDLREYTRYEKEYKDWSILQHEEVSYANCWAHTTFRVSCIYKHIMWWMSLASEIGYRHTVDLRNIDPPTAGRPQRAQDRVRWPPNTTLSPDRPAEAYKRRCSRPRIGVALCRPQPG